MRTQRRMGSHRPPAPNVSSPLYQRILQFQALSSLRQQGTDVRKFDLRFSGAAEGLGYNDAVLKDLFNSALEEPLDLEAVHRFINNSDEFGKMFVARIALAHANANTNAVFVLQN